MALEILKYLIYFSLGGLIIVITTFFGIEKEGFIAAFFAIFPFITIFTTVTIYFSEGVIAVISYINGLLFLTPILFLYLICFLYLVSKYNLWFALAISVLIYIILGLITVFSFNK